MDERSKTKLMEITAKEPEALQPSEVVFLKARREYLSEEERTKFSKLLELPKPLKEDGHGKIRKTRS